ncbi:MAG: sulfatase [Pirellulaceae bacterium]|nr:sulfatase [Pirellulaceae bacterium]
MIRPFYWLTFVIAIGFCLEVQASNSNAPNVLLLIADDMACRDCGPYGNAEIRTPHLDRLAREGMTFDRAFTATAMCAPTRQQLYTGLFPVRNGAYPNHSKVKPGTHSIVHHLRDLGYRVGLIGKKHFGPKESFPFELLNAKTGPAFLTRDKSQPFCLVVASKSPHVPWTEGPNDYDPDRLTLPSWLVDTAEMRTAFSAYASEITAFDQEVGNWLDLLDEHQLAKNTLVVATSEQGPQMPGGKWTCYEYGLQVAFLARWPTTIAAGTRSSAMVQYVDFVPTIVEAAGGDPLQIDTGQAGSDSGGRDCDGRSFLKVLKGEADDHHAWVYGIHTTQGIKAGTPFPIRSIRGTRYKYIQNLLSDSRFHNTVIEHDAANYWKSWVREAASNPHAMKLVQRYLKRPAEEFYDLEDDPYELTNLATVPAHQTRIQEMKKRLREWMQQQNDMGVETENAAQVHRTQRR